MADAEIKANVSEKAIAYGVPRKHAVLFDDLDEAFKEKFYRASSERQFGLPIVRFSHSNGFWVLIGSRELAWFDTNKIRFIDLKDIENYRSSGLDEVRKKELNEMPEKFRLEKLVLITKANQQIEVCIDAKEAYFTFQHMMIRIMKLIR